MSTTAHTPPHPALVRRLADLIDQYTQGTRDPDWCNGLAMHLVTGITTDRGPVILCNDTVVIPPRDRVDDAGHVARHQQAAPQATGQSSRWITSSETCGRGSTNANPSVPCRWRCLSCGLTTTAVLVEDQPGGDNARHS